MSVISDEVELTLKQRIQTDAPQQFPSSGWDKIKLGKYYPGVDSISSLRLIHVVVGTVLGTVLRAHGLCLTDQQLDQFFAGISTDSTSKEAIKRMLLVGGMALPCPPAAGTGGGQ